MAARNEQEDGKEKEKVARADEDIRLRMGRKPAEGRERDMLVREGESMHGARNRWGKNHWNISVFPPLPSKTGSAQHTTVHDSIL